MHQAEKLSFKPIEKYPSLWLCTLQRIKEINLPN